MQFLFGKKRHRKDDSEKGTVLTAGDIRFEASLPRETGGFQMGNMRGRCTLGWSDF